VKSWGIYLDNYSSQITVVDNCLANNASAPPVKLNTNEPNTTAQGDVCSNSTMTTAGVRPQAAAALTYVGFPEVFPAIQRMLKSTR
jgi:hypothetical protein